MTDIPPPRRPAPFSLRLTPEERLHLERDAWGMSLAAYVKWRLFDPGRPPPRRRGAAPIKDHAALARLLALLGQSRLASNLNQIAKAAHVGALPVTPELEAELRAAVAHVAEIRRELITALNLQGDAP